MWGLPQIGQAAGIGLGIANAFKDGPDTYSPWQQGNAAWQVNNPNSYTPFGSVEYQTDDKGTPNHYRDDSYSIQQNLSPEMQALADKMLGIAGRGRETFTSGGMGDRLAGRMNTVLGGRTPSTYNRGQYGFEQGQGPAMAPEPEPEAEANYDDQSYQSLVNALMGSRDQYGVGGFTGGR